MKLVKKAIDVSSAKRNMKLVMKWFFDAILSFTPQNLRTEFYFFSHKKFSIFKIPTNLLFSLEKNFSLILLLLPSKLATSVCKTLQSVVCCFLKTCLHSNELISFDYFLNAPLFFHTKFIFPFHIKVIPMKFIQDKNLELPNGEFYSR